MVSASDKEGRKVWRSWGERGEEVKAASGTAYSGTFAALIGSLGG